MKTGHQLCLSLCVFLAGNAPSLAFPVKVSDDIQWKKCLQVADQAAESSAPELAGPLYIKALSMAERFGEHDPRLVVSLHKVGSFYLYRSPPKAASYYKRSLAVMETLPRHQVLDLDLAMENGLLCEALMQQKKYAEAEQYAKKKLALEESLLRNDDGALVHSLMRIGECEFNQERFEQAEPYYKRASEIARAQNFPLLPNIFLILARIEAQACQFDKAVSYKQQAEAVKYKSDQVEFADNLRRLGVSFMRKRQWKEANDCYQEAADLLSTAPKDTSEITATLLSDRGRLCFRQEQYSQAQVLYEKALSLTRSAKLSVHKDLVEWVKSLAEVLQKQGKTEEAAKLSQQLQAVSAKSAN